MGGSEAPPLASRSLKLFSKMLAKPHADQFIRICHAATSAPGLTDRTHICAGTDVTHICAGTSSQTGPQTSVHGLCGSPVWDCFVMHGAMPFCKVPRPE